MPPTQGDSHQLTLKVMRLSKPSFAHNIPVFFEPSLEGGGLVKGATGLQQLLDGSVTALSAVQSHRISSSGDSDEIPVTNFSLSDLLVLPTSFGNIYLGETFSAYICVNNDSSQGAKDVSFRAELQTSTQRFVLHDTTDDPNPCLLATQTIEFTISHEIRELGTHILVCNVSYTGNMDEKKTFRRFYKFQVLNPLAVRTKVNSQPGGKMYLEAQVQNLMTNPMFIERLRLDPAECFACEDLNFLDGKPVFGDLTCMQPQDIQQYLFKLYPKDEKLASVAATSAVLGRLDILWRSSLGEVGRLQTNQLGRRVPPAEVVECHVTKVPNRIVAEVPFNIMLKVKNCSRQNAKLGLVVIKEKMGSLWFIGNAMNPLGEFLPDETKEVSVSLFPSTPGIHRIEGLRIVNELSNDIKDLELREVLVLSLLNK